MPDDVNAARPDASPEEVVRAAAEALAAERWEDVLPLVSPEALATFRDSRITGLRAMLEMKPRSADEILRAEPWSTPAIAEFQANEEKVYAERGRPQLLREWGVESADELEPLSSEELFVRFLAAHSPRARLRAAWAVSHTPVDDPARMVDEYPSFLIRRTVLGSVIEGDFAHVVFRETREGEISYPGHPGESGCVRLTTLDRTPHGWRLRTDHTLLETHDYIRVWHSSDEEKSSSAGETDA